MSLDRFAQGAKDAQEEVPILECSCCGFGIYDGEEVWVLEDGSYSHMNWLCLYGRFVEKNNGSTWVLVDGDKVIATWLNLYERFVIGSTQARKGVR